MQNIESRSSASTTKMNDLLLKLDETKINLMNVTSKLLALQNNQFVENRVCEDDETIANVSEVPKTDSNVSILVLVKYFVVVFDSGSAWMFY